MNNHPRKERGVGAFVSFSMTRFAIASLAVLALSACATVPEASPPVADPVTSRPQPPEATRILDARAAERLLAAKGITLQWIGWNERGSVNVRREGDLILLTGSQSEPNGLGRLFLDGSVTEIGSDYFLFDGIVRMTDTPDRGRTCEADNQWRFAITQNRPYWRLREFEWCDGLTDYIDIYF